MAGSGTIPEGGYELVGYSPIPGRSLTVERYTPGEEGILEAPDCVSWGANRIDCFCISACSPPWMAAIPSALLNFLVSFLPFLAD